MGSQSRLTVLLFTDVVDSAELKHRMGAAIYTTVLERHNAIFESICSPLHAEVLKHTGDGFFAAFATASDAIRAALRFQDAIRNEPWSHPLSVRIGIHIGEVAMMEMAGRPDLVGVAADVAARITALASAGQILLTRFAFNDARQFVNDPGLKWVAHGSYLFRGIDDAVEVFEVGAEATAPLSPPANQEKARRVVPHDQEPTLGWRPAVGLPILGRPGWALERKLGEGGFGEVWLGRHDRTKQARVFKFCFDAERLRSFKRELTFFRLLRDALGDREDIARLYEVKLDEPPFFLESEWTEGGNLVEWSESQGGIAKVSLDARLDIVARIAAAVAAAHSVGILHKDIKPANVLIQNGVNGQVQPRLADFGIGMLAHRRALDDRHITASGFTEVTEASSSSYTAGTRLYAPPEVLAGKPFTTQGDIYGLGVLLYQVAAGDLHRPLAEGWQRDVPDEMLREDIAACVEGDPDRRLHSAAELAGRLRGRQERLAQRIEQRRLTERIERRRRIAHTSYGVAALLLVLLALAAIGLFRERRLRAAAEFERHRAELNLAYSLVEQGNALESLVGPSQSRPIYLQARDVFARLGSSPLAAELGLLDSYDKNAPPLAELTGHTDAILCLALSRDGKLALTGSKDGTLRLWELPTGRLIHILKGHEHWVIGCAISPDAKLALSCGDDKEHQVRLWDLQSGTPIANFDGHTDIARVVAFAPDGKLAASGGMDSDVRIWDVASHQTTHVLQDAAGVLAIAFSPDGHFLMSGTGDGQEAMTLWDIATGGEVRHFPINLVRAIGFTPDGARAVSATYHGRLTVWDLRSGQGRDLPFGADVALAISPDGRQVLGARQDGFVGIWDIDDDPPASEPRNFTTPQLPSSPSGVRIRSFVGMTDGVRSVAWSPDKQTIMAAGLDRTICVWQLRPASEFLRYATSVWAGRTPAFSEDGNTVFALSDLKLQRFDAATMLPLGEADVPVHASGNARILQGRFACWTTPDSMIVVELSSGRICFELPLPGADNWDGDATYLPETGRLILTRKPQHTDLSIWDVRSGKQLCTLKGHETEVSGVVATRAGSRVASASLDNSVRLWDPESGNELKRANFTNSVTALALSPDDRVLLAGDRAGRIYLMDLETLNVIRQFIGHSARIQELCFSRDGRLAASYDVSSVVRVWDVESGRSLHAFANGGKPAFSPNGTTLLLSSAKGPAALQEIDFTRAARHLDFNARLAAAREALNAKPDDAGALLTFGEFYAFRSVNDLAVEYLERARDAGADVSPLVLARCRWQAGDLPGAANDFRIAKDRKLASADYLDLCLKAVEHPRPVSTTSIIQPSR